jgi:hypothetical protein
MTRFPLPDHISDIFHPRKIKKIPESVVLIRGFPVIPRIDESILFHGMT